MRRAERLYRLVDEMRDGVSRRGRVRAEDLAERLEVSVRTVYRDIAALQASGLPIEGEAGVGYLLRPGFDRPSVTFTHDQVDALAIGLATVEGSRDPVLATAAREVRAKLQAGMPRTGAARTETPPAEPGRLADAPFFDLSASPAPQHADALRAAIRERRVLTVDYADAEDRTTTRRLRPLAIWRLADGWMFTAWCELRDDFRTFRLDRIAALAPTGETFADEPDRNLATFLATEGCSAD